MGFLSGVIVGIFVAIGIGIGVFFFWKKFIKK